MLSKTSLHWWAVALAAMLALVLPAGLALAHGVVVKAEPAPFAILDKPPTTVTVWANEPVSRLSNLRVLNAQGQRVDVRGTRVDPANRRLQVDLLPTGEGRYTVLWTLNSLVDGHTTQGSYVFAVGGGGATALEGFPPPGKVAPPVLTGSVWNSAQVVQSLALWVVLLAALLLVGACVFRLSVPHLLTGTARTAWAGLAQRAGSRWASAERLLLVSLAASTIVAALAVGAGAGQSWAKATSPPFMWEILSSTPFGLATMAKGALAVLLLAAGLVLSRQRTGVILTGGMAYLGLVAYTGHAAAVAQPLRIAVVLDWLHLVAASIWLGGMAFVAVALLPARGREKGKSRRVGTTWQPVIAVLSGFSPIALASVAVLVATGAYNSVTRLSGPGDLLSAGFGRVLVAKAVLVAAMLAMSFANAFLVRPRLKTALEAPPRKPPPQAERLRRLLRWEPLVGVAVIAATALLAAYPPPGLGRSLDAGTEGTEAVAEEPRFAIGQRSGDLMLVLRMGPGDVGRNGFEVELSHAADGSPVEGPVEVTAEAALLDQEAAALSIPIEREPDGHYRGEGDFAFEGQWRLEVTVGREGNPEVTSTFQFPLPVNNATALLARAQQAMNGLSSLRMEDTLDNGAGLVIESTTEFQAPGRMYLKTSEGREIYIIGEDRYLKQPGGSWQVGRGPAGQPYKFPDFNFREGYLQPVIVDAERIGGQPHSIVAVYDSRAQLYYLKWIGADDNLVRRWQHIGPGHFLDSRLSDFNSGSISISPPQASGP